MGQRFAFYWLGATTGTLMVLFEDFRQKTSVILVSILLYVLLAIFFWRVNDESN